MSRLLPFKRPVSHSPTETSVVGLTGETADEVFATLSSATARTILDALYEDPQAAVDLRELTGTSLQNIHYHLTNMENAGLIEVVDTWYSEKGSEMKVYAPSARAVMILASTQDDRGLFTKLLSRVFVAVLMAGVATVLFTQWLAQLTEPSTQVSLMETTSTVATAPSPISPTLAFCLGALVGIVLFASVWAVTERRAL
jgi:DNA-binding transcriptional ArsR family regulator